MMQTKGLLSEKEAATFLGISQRTLSKWRQDGKGPTFQRLSRRLIRYRQEDLERFLEANTFYGGMKS